jgi:hypothetical protein
MEDGDTLRSQQHTCERHKSGQINILNFEFNVIYNKFMEPG